MARWGLCWGFVFGILAVGAVGAAMRWPDGATDWIGWVAFAVFGWGAIMSVYAFDRPAPAQPPRVRQDRDRARTEHSRQEEGWAEQ
jgi:hypothetical protein